MTARVSRVVPPWAHYIVDNLVAGVVTPLRSPRGLWTKRLVPAWRRYPVAAGVVAVAVAVSMIWLDAPAMRAVAALPHRLTEAFNEITDFGRAGWPLVPICIVFFATPLLSSPRLAFMSRGVITTSAVRLGYMFAAIGLTGLAETILKR